MRPVHQFLIVNAVLYICCLTIYLCIMLLTPEALVTQHNTTINVSPVILATCYKYMEAAESCRERLGELGFNNIRILNGDDFEDGGVDVPIKSSNFRATCLEMVKGGHIEIILLELFFVS